MLQAVFNLYYINLTYFSNKSILGIQKAMPIKEIWSLMMF